MADAVAQTLQRALGLHQQGFLAEAEALYRQILHQAPLHFDAVHLSGLAAFQRQDFETALRLINQALQIDPNNASAHANLGAVHHARKRYEAALACFERALQLAPGRVEDWRKRGLVLADLGRFDAALASYDHGLALQPDHIGLLVNRALFLFGLKQYEAAIAGYDRALALRPNDYLGHYVRGTCLLEVKRYDEALAALNRALALQPGDVPALANRGTVLRALHNSADALASYDQALIVRPDDVVLLNNRGLVLADLGRHEAAIACYDRALAVTPDHGESLINRGAAQAALGWFDAALASYDRALIAHPTTGRAHADRGAILLKLGRIEHAIASLDRALALDPDQAAALNNRGTALQALGQAEAALACYDRALALDPDHLEALNNRGSTLQALRRPADAVAAFKHLLGVRPDFPYTQGHRLSSQLQSCDWHDYDRIAAEIAHDVAAGQRVADPFVFLSTTGSATAQRRCAERYAADKYPAATPIGTDRGADHDRIRIAYLSGDFHDHPVAHLLTGVIERHDRSKFESFALSFGHGVRDAATHRLEAAFDHFHDVRARSDFEIAQMTASLAIDIAIDLMGFTNGARPGIFAFRPAPIQINYLGYPGTMGADYIDYLIADRFTVPDERRAAYAEQIAALPDCVLPGDPTRLLGRQIPSRSDAGLPRAGFVFCSFNNHYKILPEIFSLWLRLLHQIDGSVLWLTAGDETARRNLRLNAKAQGIKADRLIFAPRLPDRADHLARHCLADLMLDTLPYNAHVTAADALWAGLPLVTCAGSSFAGRVAGSLLTAIGLPELITGTLDEYEALALKLAREPGLLAEIRAKLDRNRAGAGVFDIDRYRRHLESAYTTMWQRHRRGEKPMSFAVDSR